MKKLFVSILMCIMILGVLAFAASAATSDLTWQQKLEMYKTDKAVAQTEILRAKDVWQKEASAYAQSGETISFNLTDRGIQISRWIDQVRTAAKISTDDPLYRINTPLRIGVFNTHLAMQVAQAKGIFSKYNLTVDIMQVKSSTQQFEYLRDGKYDVIKTALDNVVTYNLNQNNPLKEIIDSQIFMSTEYAESTTLVAKADIASIKDLKGKTVAVDAKTSGYAYILYKMLANHGLEAEKDYHVISVGGTPLRYKALIEGKAAAALLSSESLTMAEKDGYKFLDSSRNIVYPYIGSIMAAKKSWLQTNPDVAERLVLALYEAGQWVGNPSNRNEIIQILKTQQKISEDDAVKLYDIQIKQAIFDGSVNQEAFANVLRLREEFNGFDEKQDIEKLSSADSPLLNLSFLQKVTSSPEGSHR